MRCSYCRLDRDHLAKVRVDPPNAGFILLCGPCLRALLALLPPDPDDSFCSKRDGSLLCGLPAGHGGGCAFVRPAGNG